MVVIAAEQHATRLVVPSSQRMPATRWTSHEDIAAKVLRKLAGPHVPGVTPHTLRRTFASLCFFAGRDLRWVMGQLGHDDPRMTLGVYAQCMKRSQVE